MKCSDHPKIDAVALLNGKYIGEYSIGACANCFKEWKKTQKKIINSQYEASSKKGSGIRVYQK